eukprot:3738424-Alexandrium_andersonii.AAC.1
MLATLTVEGPRKGFHVVSATSQHQLLLKSQSTMFAASAAAQVYEAYASPTKTTFKGAGLRWLHH